MAAYATLMLQYCIYLCWICTFRAVILLKCHHTERNKMILPGSFQIPIPPKWVEARIHFSLVIVFYNSLDAMCFICPDSVIHMDSVDFFFLVKSVFLIFSFLCCMLVLFVVVRCLVPNVACVTVGCPLCFLQTLFVGIFTLYSLIIYNIIV